MNYLFLLLFGFGLGPSSYAKSQHWKINDDHSEILFEIPYLKISKVTGRLRRFRGHVFFNNDTSLDPSEIKLQIDADSIYTGQSLRDGHLRSEDFLGTKEFPTISFSSTEIRKLKSNKYTAKGTLTFKGKEQPLSVSYEITSSRMDAWNKPSRFVGFNFTLHRKDLGLTWNKALDGGDFLLGDEIKIYGHFQIQPANDTTPTSNHMIPSTQYTELKNSVTRGELSRETFDDKFRKKDIAVSTSSQAPELNYGQPRELPPSNQQSAPQEHTLGVWWYIWFLTLSFFGFIGSILAMFFIKTKIADTKQNYQELGFWGTLSDVPTLIIGTLYACSVWYVYTSAVSLLDGGLGA